MLNSKSELLLALLIVHLNAALGAGGDCPIGVRPTRSSIKSITWPTNSSPTVWEMNQMCWLQHPGSGLLRRGSIQLIAAVNRTNETSTNQVIALNLTDGSEVFVNEDYKFTCALCQQLGRVYIDRPVHPGPLDQPQRVNGVTMVSNSSINGGDLTATTATAELLATKLANLFTDGVYDSVTYNDILDVPLTPVVINFVMTHAVQVNTSQYVGLLIDGFILTAFFSADMCPDHETADTGKEVTWSRTRIGSVRSIHVGDRLVLQSRECVYDVKSHGAKWAPVNTWDNVFEHCLRDRQRRIITNIKQSLTLLAREPVNMEQLETIANITNEASLLDYRHEPSHYVTQFVILNAIAESLMNFNHLSACDDTTVDSGRVGFLIANNEECSHPVVGSSVTLLENKTNWLKESKIQPIRSNETNDLTESSNYSVILSSYLVTKFTCVSITTFTGQSFLLPKFTYRGFEQTVKDLAVQITLYSPHDRNKPITINNDMFIDFYFTGESRQVNKLSKRTVAVWNQNKKHWSENPCHKLKFKRNTRDVFRCKLLSDKDNIGNVYVGRFAVYYIPTGFSDYLETNHVLVIVLVIQSCFSLIGLMSILLTAIVIKKWREDVGHKILLHMAASLSFNLVFGFANNFFKVDPTNHNSSCIALGVLLHYSYLAMLCWMLVLASLQLRRLYSVLGPRAIDHLLLKVSLFAWGAPILIIAPLLMWNAQHYRSVVTDKGFCYPEGVAFIATVQAPSAVILVANAVIFCLILGRIYSCCGWGMRYKPHFHGPSARTAHLRRLKTSFIIFLFGQLVLGLTYAFHFLAEEQVVRSEFMYEYLFLLTATTHALMLAVVFVYLDKDVRQDWLKVFRKLKLQKNSKSIALDKFGQSSDVIIKN